MNSCFTITVYDINNDGMEVSVRKCLTEHCISKFRGRKQWGLGELAAATKYAKNAHWWFMILQQITYIWKALMILKGQIIRWITFLTQ